jgi:hypothetical protein
MLARSIIYAAVLAVCAPTAWANTAIVDVYGVMGISVDNTLPTHETYSAAADVGTNIFNVDPVYVPLLDVTTAAGATAQIASAGYSSSASTTLGSNHAYTSASIIPSYVSSAGSFSGWYDQVTITGGTGTGTAQFTVQLNGSVDVGAIAGMAGYGLVTSSIHPSVLGTDIIVDVGTPTSPWFLIASEVNPVIGYSILASPYNDPDHYSGLFGAPPTPTLDGIPAIDDPSKLLGGDAGMGFPDLDLVLTPGAGQGVNVTLTGTLTFTYGEAFYLISTLNTGLLELNAFQTFCSFDTECPVSPPIDGTGATTLDFSNSANLVNIALPQGATASFASGETYNVTSVPEPAEWLMLLAGLGLVGWRARRRS